MGRVSWDDYFLDIADKVATRSTCNRLNVGAVIVKNRTILSTGYNGSISGTPHCDDEGHIMEKGHCVRTVHAEANAIVQAAKNGVKVEGASLYATYLPCWNCFKLIVNSGIKKIVFKKPYRTDPRVIEHAERVGVELVDYSEKSCD
jgi:dCMP deaminase